MKYFTIKVIIIIVLTLIIFLSYYYFNSKEKYDEYDQDDIQVIKKKYKNYNKRVEELINFIYDNRVEKYLSKYLIVLDRYKIKTFAKENNIPFIPVVKVYDSTYLDDIYYKDFPKNEFRVFVSSHGERVLNIYNKEGERYIGAIDLSLDAKLFSTNWIKVKQKLLEWINTPSKYKISNLIKPTVYTTIKPQNNMAFDVYCINGRAEYIQLDMWDVSGNFTGGPACRGLFDRDYNRLRCKFIYPRCNEKSIPKNLKTARKFFFQKPKKLKQIILDAEKVAKDLPFIMVAFYLFYNEDYVLTYTRIDVPHIEIEINPLPKLQFYPLRCDKRFMKLIIKLNKKIDKTFKHIHSNKIKHIQQDTKYIDGNKHYHLTEIKDINKMNDPKFININKKYLESFKQYTKDNILEIKNTNNNLLIEEIKKFFKNPKVYQDYPKYKKILSRYYLKFFNKKHGIPHIPVHKIYNIYHIQNLRPEDLPSTGFRMFDIFGNDAGGGIINSNRQLYISAEYIRGPEFTKGYVPIKQRNAFDLFKASILNTLDNPIKKCSNKEWCKSLIKEVNTNFIYSTIQSHPKLSEYEHWARLIYMYFHMYHGNFGYGAVEIYGVIPPNTSGPLCRTIINENYKMLSCTQNFPKCKFSNLYNDLHSSKKELPLLQEKWNTMIKKPKDWSNMVRALKIIAKDLPYIRIGIYYYYKTDEWVISWVDVESPDGVEGSSPVKFKGFNPIECHDKYYRMWKDGFKSKEKFQQSCDIGEWTGIL